MKQPYSREQRSTIVYGILCLTLFTVILQLWLLTATMNAFMGGDNRVLWPAALASLGCFVFNLYVLRFVYLMERQDSRN
jgi:hypothetical protein